MLRFSCTNCGQKFKLPVERAGKKGRCPKCKASLIVPNPTAPGPPAAGTSGCPETTAAKPLLGLNFLDVSPTVEQPPGEPQSELDSSDLDHKQEQPLILGYRAPGPEPASQRRLPWVIDIFLYPINKPGLTTLAIIVMVPLLINLMAGLLGPFGFFVLIPGFFINIVIGLYYFWYLARCIQDSALGGIRAAETIGDTPGLGEMFSQALQIGGCYILFLAPTGIYYFYGGRETDPVFWSLFGCSLFFFPMGLLAVIMFDSLSGLNPILLIGSIFSTFLPYCGLVILLYVIVFIFNVAGVLFAFTPLLGYLLGLLPIYLLVVTAHILGRFYWRYEKKLNWEV